MWLVLCQILHHYSKTCLNGHLYLKDSLYIKDTLLSSRFALLHKMNLYCEIIIFRGGSIFVVFVDTINNEFTSPTNYDV